MDIRLNDQSELEREPWVDFVRVSAIFLVVLLHSAAPWLYRYGQIANFDWQVGNIIDSATRVSVPLFFMITGYLLLNKPLSLKPYFTKRINRIVIPWIVWSCIYLVYKNVRSDMPISLTQGLIEFANGEIYFHLWFLYALVGLYLFIPVLVWIIESDMFKRSLYFLVAWIITASIIPFFNMITKYASNYELDIAVDLSMFGGFSGYLLAGYLIGKVESSKIQFALLTGAYAIGVFLTFFGTGLGTVQLGRFTEYFYGYTAPNVIFAAFAVFAVLKKVGTRIGENKKRALAIARMGHATLGIYLIHPIILNAINEGLLGPDMSVIIQKSALTIPFVAIATYTLSYVFVEFILLIPVIRKIV